MSDNDLIFSFDIGTGSIGECVRQGSEIKHLESLLIPAEYASTKDATKKRHQIRTREAHKAREDWWRKQAKEAGIEVLESRQPTKENPNIKPDERLLREFPKDGDNTIYTSCLLRIALLQGKKLDGWQIYKAVWSAIQHRGYDKNLPWITRIKRNIEEENEDDSGAKNESTMDEKENIEGVGNYYKYLKDNFGDNKEFWYPCYYEAHKIGIWSPANLNDLSVKIGTNPNSARNKGKDKNYAVSPRELIKKELEELLKKAAEQFHKIKGKEKYIIYGLAEKEYASYIDKTFYKYRGKNWEWQGLLGQKVPRFDNRIISKCALIPRLNVCKAGDQLNKEVTFLMKLKNTKYVSHAGEELSFTSEQINKLFEKYKEKAYITKTQLEKWIKTELNGYSHPVHIKIDKSKTSGRSRFCRPALLIIKEIILSGKSPHDIYKEKITNNIITDSNKGLINGDYYFLLNMPKEWEKFWIPDKRENFSKISENKRIEEIETTIGEINNPIVRHRLNIFCDRLKKLKQKFSEPKKIVIEFIREDFMGDKKRREYIKIMNQRRKAKDEAFNEIKDLVKGKQSLIKQLLLKEQGCKDIYSYETLIPSQLNDYEIDHIVPRSKGGSDAMYNKVLTKASNNQEKGNRIPFEWLSADKEKWNMFYKNVESFRLNWKKKELLLAKDPTLLIEKYTTLAETAYITKLTQKIAHLFFGWDWQTKGSHRKIIVQSGGYTSKIRKIFKLNALLYPEKTGDEIREIVETGKNRDNKRHHALDALVLSITPEIKYDEKKDADVYPVWFNPEYCKNALDKVNPTYIDFEKPVLAETIYGKRTVNENGEKKEYFISKMKTGLEKEWYLDVINAKKYSKDIFDSRINKDFTREIEKNPTQEEWEKFVNIYFKNNRPKKLSLIQSDSPEIFKEINSIKGQYFTDKREHQGQLVYKNEKKWKVEPVFVYESLYLKRKEYEKKYGKVYFFNSLCQVKTNKDISFGRSNQLLSKGFYILRTITEGGQVKLESNNGLEFVIALSILMEEAQMERVD